MRAIGLMSGTSLDGVDAAIIETDGTTISAFGGWLTHPYSTTMQECIRDVLAGKGDVAKVEHNLTLAHIEAVQTLLKQEKLSPSDIDVIGFHGQTVIHRPDEGITWQVGDGALLAERTGINVVSDFRRHDMAAGGQGAPLVPLYHAALVQNHSLPVAIVNIGGVANVTWVGKGEHNIVAFDTGPGNAMINDWMLRHTGALYDDEGKLAGKGIVDNNALEQLLSHDFFQKKAPKSLDRNSFSADAVAHLSPEDGAATLTAFTVAAIAKAREHFPETPQEWFITGGGRHNTTIMHQLQQQLGNRVYAIEEIGSNGDALEAQAFAFLAVRSLLGLPLSLPNTTGVTRPVTGGAFYRA